MADLKVKIHDLELKNPVTVASGTFGFGEEMSEFFDFLLRALLQKTGKATITRAWLKHLQEC
jgi:dihydroorotate dehydrogenase